MNTLKLHEIINYSEKLTPVLIELIVPYKKSLLTYYKDQYKNDPILVVTSVFNAAQYGFITCADNYIENHCQDLPHPLPALLRRTFLLVFEFSEILYIHYLLRG